MRIISPKRIRDATNRIDDPELARDLSAWLQTAKGTRWQSFVELRQTFPAADSVDGLVIFNIRRNRYRLIARVVYSRWSEPDRQWTPGQILVGDVLTHAEYDRWSRLTSKRRKETIWPPC